MKNNIKKLAELVNGTIVGDQTIIIFGVASIEKAQTGDIIFVENSKFLEKALLSQASAIVLPKKLVPKDFNQKVLILVDQAKLAFAQIINVIHPSIKVYSLIETTAIIANTAQLALDVSVGHHSIIGKKTKIGSCSVIGSNCVIGQEVEIGQECVIHSNVTIYDKVKILDRVVIHSGSVIGSDGFGYVFYDGQYHKFPQIGDVIIESDVEIGSNVSIDRGALDSTVIGQGTKIDNLVQIAHNVKIGKTCVLAAQVGVSGSSIIEDNVIVGGQVGIADHVRIESGAIIGAQAGIPTGKIIRRGLTVWGTPARPIDDFKRIYGQTQQLPMLKEKLLKLEKEIAELKKIKN
ncbi:MAG: UDP-3-O-(3-hydroxymyristoyl)glucosamine N-acyltransferase [Acidobacteria bacterium]|nr:UDP-3-O-(3-hydroxymyristoyl)glucosamine N-acyltransferase [Acidobacteriota bacterium]